MFHYNNYKLIIIDIIHLEFKYYKNKTNNITLIMY